MEQLFGDYARVLRAIGQDLKHFFPESLEIVITDEGFVARGRGRLATPDEQIRAKAVLWNTWNEPSAPRPGSNNSAIEQSNNEFSRLYTWEKISRLDEMGKACRSDPSQSPDLYSLEERLRIIGRIMDQKQASLMNIRLDVNDLTFEYRDQQGEVHREVYSAKAFHKLQEQYYSERSLGRRIHGSERGRVDDPTSRGLSREKLKKRDYD